MQYPVSTRVLVPDDKIPEDLSCFNSERCSDAERWVKQTGWPLIIANKSWDEIKDTYSLYKSKSISKQELIDLAAMRIYKKTTEQIYKLLKNKFANDGKSSENDTIEMIKEEVSNGDEDSILQYVLEESKKDLPPHTEYNIRKIMTKFQPKDVSMTIHKISFSPEQIRSLIGTYSDSPAKEFPYEAWLEAYDDTYNGYISSRWEELESKRIAFLEDFSSMETLDRMKYNEMMIRLGVNPEISRYANITVTPPVEIIDVSKFITGKLGNSGINESTNKFDLFKPVFIVFKRTKESVVNSVIAKFTRSFWAHAAISFDYTLKECYTFDFYHHGFVKESIYSYPKGSIINVVGCFVSTNVYIKMQEEITNYKKIKKQTSYSLQNLIHCLAKKANEDTKSMVCSNFVDYMLKLGDISPSKMSWSIMTPGRLRKSIAHNKKKHFYELYKGTIEEYNANKILLYLSKVNVVNEESTTEDLDQDCKKLYKELIEPFINLVPIEEDKPLVIHNDINVISKLTNINTYI